MVYGMPKSVRHRPNCANLSCLCGKSVNYAQTMCKLCVNSSCQCGHSLARIRVLVVNSS